MPDNIRTGSAVFTVRLAAVALGMGIIVLTACEVPRPNVSGKVALTAPTAATLTALGRTIFFDTTLSASGRMSCATCHDPLHGWGPANARPVQLGGVDGTAPGVRATPSLGYAQDTPPFIEHYRENDGDDSEDLGPTGGRMWDGRAESAQEQAAMPLLSPFEMANVNRAEVLTRLQASPTAAAFRAAFGPEIFRDSLAAWNGLLAALDVFQQSPEEFYPYTSKYDAFLRGQVRLTAREQRGLALFNDPGKGNCAECHPSAMVRGAFPQFTDHGFMAIGVPRNPRIAANADTSYFDLGLCGPWRHDLADRKDFCGLFKTPTLRNVARRPVFFHNGVFTALEEVLRFYANRDVAPGEFYMSDNRGRTIKYDDLPGAYHSNVNVDPPFNRRLGQSPAFSDAESADIIVFLQTLNDGFVPPPGGAR